MMLLHLPSTAILGHFLQICDFKLSWEADFAVVTSLGHKVTNHGEIK